MKTGADILIGLVALSHLGFLVLEMFFWDHPVGRRIFNMTPEVSASSAVLAANQGLYNGFLAAGLIWGLARDRRDLKVFFLACVVVAGVFGGLTAKPTILFTQALPGGRRAGHGLAPRAGPADPARTPAVGTASAMAAGARPQSYRSRASLRYTEGRLRRVENSSTITASLHKTPRISTA